MSVEKQLQQAESQQNEDTNKTQSQFVWNNSLKQNKKNSFLILNFSSFFFVLKAIE